MTDDYLAAIKTAWAATRPPTRAVRVLPRRAHGAAPAAAPHPPIWVGGASDAALRRAVLTAMPGTRSGSASTG